MKKAPDACTPDAFTSYGGQKGIRTPDTRIFSPLLYQLSYLAKSAANDSSFSIPKSASRSSPISVFFETACKTAICLSLAPLSYILYLWMAAGMLRVNPFTILQELLEAVMVFCVPSVIIVYGASQLPKWNRERKREKQRRQTQQRIEKNAQKLKPKKAKYSVKDR